MLLLAASSFGALFGAVSFFLLLHFTAVTGAASDLARLAIALQHAAALLAVRLWLLCSLLLLFVRFGLFGLGSGRVLALGPLFRLGHLQGRRLTAVDFLMSDGILNRDSIRVFGLAVFLSALRGPRALSSSARGSTVRKGLFMCLCVPVAFEEVLRLPEHISVT